MPIISLKNINVAFDAHVALHNISFSVHAGEYIGLIGPNGAGKSTLMKVIAGGISPNSGTIEIQKNTTLGYVPQNYFLHTSFTISVEEVLDIASPLLFFWENTKQKEEKEKYVHVLKLVGLSPDFLQKNFQELSGGQKQRVIIARSLLKNPDVLLFDEPLSGVDFDTKIQIYDLLATLNKKHHTTIIFVSHEIESIIAKCDRVLCLNKTLHEECHPMHVSKEKILKPIHHHHSLTQQS